MISLEEFSQIDLRVGEVRAAEPIGGSDRLLKLSIDMGSEIRTVVGGLAKSYRPEELLGLQVVIAANLQPARIRGIESSGMLLGVGCTDPTQISLLTVHRSAANGARVS